MGKYKISIYGVIDRATDNACGNVANDKALTETAGQLQHQSIADIVDQETYPGGKCKLEEAGTFPEYSIPKTGERTFILRREYFIFSTIIHVI